METRAVRDGDEWVINGEKTWNTGIHKAPYDLIFARTSGEPGDGDGITAFLVPTDAHGFEVEEFLWTFNMPTDHATISLTDVRVPDDAIFGGEGKGLQVVQHFFNENRIRQAASSLGAAEYCINEAVAYAKQRAPFGKPLSTNQAIQFPLVELQTQCEMLRALIHKTAWQMDTYGPFSVSEKVSMCNYWANRLCCEAADRAMQVHGGLGYSRHKPFEHIYRHHRRYRITEGVGGDPDAPGRGLPVRLHEAARAEGRGGVTLSGISVDVRAPCGQPCRSWARSGRTSRSSGWTPVAIARPLTTPGTSSLCHRAGSSRRWRCAPRSRRSATRHSSYGPARRCSRDRSLPATSRSTSRCCAGAGRRPSS